MKLPGIRNLLGAFALVLGMSATAAEPPGTKIAGEHLDFYLNDPSSWGMGLGSASVSGDTLTAYGSTAFMGSEWSYYTDMYYASFYVVAHAGYSVQMTPAVSFIGAYAGVDDWAPGNGAADLKLFTYVERPSGEFATAITDWYSPYMQPGQSVDQQGGTHIISGTPNSPAVASVMVSLDLFLLADPGAYVGVSGFQFVFNAVPLTVPTPVPEPETYAMLLAGLALLGVAARRRRRL